MHCRRVTKLIVVLLGSLVLNVLACGAIGLSAWAHPQSDDPQIEPAAIMAQLRFTFGEAVQWNETIHDGSAHHGALIRRSLVSGQTATEPGRPYAERVLKIGWPFTTLRTFVRRVDGDLQVEGGLILGDRDVEISALRVLPLQVVWPGLVFNTLLLAAALGLIVVLVQRRRPRPGQA